ncbi:MAG: ABC transporter ATP-binding protein [Caldilineae bacterium]|nr:ABC transporter ATP-binding protein [Caldilineae bacterium]
MALLEVAGISKSFDETAVLHDVSFTAGRGEIVCLLGPSGCGKTTLLRIVAGLEEADEGEVRFEGRDLAGVPVHQRGFGFMFQEYALFPHRNVFDNVAFGLRMAGMARAEIETRVGEMLALVGLAGYETRRVHELSGGQQQRVALARSLAPGPALLMLDEPLGSLDRALREELMTELRRILNTLGLTAIYVTHDQQEAFAIADRVLVMNAGRIEQAGTPVAVYSRPATPFVARFLGMHNLIEGRMLAAGEPGVVETAVGTLHCERCAPAGSPEALVTVLLRPDAAHPLSLHGDTELENIVTGTLRDLSFRGSQVRIEVETGTGIMLRFELPARQAAALPGKGKPVALSIDPAGVDVLTAPDSQN